MLTADELELLTAAVDGELSPRQRRQLARLLKSKPEARRVYDELRGDSRELQALPLIPAPSDLHQTIVEAAARLPAPRPASQPRQPRQPRPVPGWALYAAAAVVLLAVGLTSFFLHSWQRGPSVPHVKAPPQSPQPEEPKTLPPPREWVEAPPPTPPKGPLVHEMPPIRIIEGDGLDDEFDEMPLPITPVRPHAPVLASGETEPLGRLERVELALPRLHVLHGLSVPAQNQALRDQLGKGNAFRVELPARDATRALERLRTALATLKTPLLLDANVQARLKKPSFRSDFAVYLEDISPDALTEVLRLVGQADRAAAEKKANEMYLEGPLVVKEMTAWDRRDLKDLLGIDPLLDRPQSKAQAIDIRKPLNEMTDKQVNEALEGRGVPRPGSKVLTPGRGLIQAVGVPRGKSPELKKFLDSCGPAVPGTIQVLIVLRNVG